MSAFPYTTTSPPPTAGPLPVIERANQSSGPYGGGGGGGGGGTNPVVSTVTVANTVLITDDQGDYQDGGILWTGANPGRAWPTGLGLNGITGGGLADATVPMIWRQGPGPVNGPGELAVGRLYMCDFSAATNESYIQNTADNVSIVAKGSLILSPTTVSSLTVSSINGAAPSGGGVNPTGISTNQVASATSTLTLSGTDFTRIVIDDTKGLIELTAGAGGGKFDLNGYSTIVRYDLNVSSINGAAPGGGGGAPPAVVSTISSIFNLSSINSGSPGLLTVAGSILATDYLGAGQVSTASVVSIVPGGAVSIQNLGTSTISSAAPQINMTAPVGMSSLVVSSINGAAPGGGSSAFFSTLYSGSSTINCDAAVTTTLLNFGTTIGHVYQIQTQMNIQGNGGQEGTENDDVVQEVVNQLFLNTTQGSFISTANAAARDVNIGTSGMWKATQGTQALAISGSFSTQVVMTGVSLLDFGAI